MTMKFSIPERVRVFFSASVTSSKVDSRSRLSMNANTSCELWPIHFRSRSDDDEVLDSGAREGLFQRVGDLVQSRQPLKAVDERKHVMRTLAHSLPFQI